MPVRRRMSIRVLEVTTLAFISAGMQAQQNHVTSRGQFEVASVKQVQESNLAHSVSLNISHGRLSVDAATLRQIVGFAYGIQRVLVQGGPAWSDGERFDILAKAEDEGATEDSIREMLRSLLVDRFKLSVHRETKELQGYALVPAKSAPKLKIAKSGEATAFTPVMNGLVFQKMPIAGLVNYLANLAGSPVQDLTGLTDFYDFKLDLSSSPASPAEPNGTNSGVVDRFGKVSAAVEDQLGLKVEARKVQIDVLAVDHAEHPTPN